MQSEDPVLVRNADGLVVHVREQVLLGVGQAIRCRVTDLPPRASLLPPDPLLRHVPPNDQESERAALGCAMLSPVALDELAGLVKPQDFYSTPHARIFSAILDLHHSGRPVDVVLLNSELDERGELEAVGGTHTLAGLTQVVPTPANATWYGRRVRDCALRRRLIEATAKIQRDAFHTTGPVSDLATRAEQVVFEVTRQTDKSEPQPLAELVEEVYQRATSEEAAKRSGVPTGLEDLDDILSPGLLAEGLTLVAARPSMGKAQPLDERVLMACGSRKPIGRLAQGDRLASVDGASSEVLGVYPQGRRQVYRVTFSDGRNTEACAEHLWEVWHRKWGPRVYSTGELGDLLQTNQGRIWTDRQTGDWGDPAWLPVSPYMLGVLLGDGSLTAGVMFTNSEPEIVNKIEDEVRSIGRGLYMARHTPISYRISTPKGQPNCILDAMRSLGLIGRKSIEKFIPLPYLRASRPQRLQLLQGLMDTDGWVEKHGSVMYSTSSAELSRGFRDLARGLGLWCSAKVKPEPVYSYKGEKRTGQPAHISCLDASPEVFTLKRKRDRVLERRARKKRLTITSIEPTRVTETACIRVSHPRSLYLTGGHVLTHNSSLAQSVALNIAKRGEPVAFWSLEVPKVQVTTNLAAAEAEVPNVAIRSASLSSVERKRLAETLNELADLPLYVDDHPRYTALEMASSIRRQVARHSIRVAVVDYLQLLQVENARNPRHEEVGAMGRILKEVARELGIAVVALCQLSRKVDERRNKRPLMSDLRESGNLEQDADTILLLWRPAYYDSKAPRHEAHAIVAKNRNGPTGDVELRFDASYTRFSNRGASKPWLVHA